MATKMHRQVRHLVTQFRKLLFFNYFEINEVQTFLNQNQENSILILIFRPPKIRKLLTDASMAEKGDDEK